MNGKTLSLAMAGVAGLVLLLSTLVQPAQAAVVPTQLRTYDASQIVVLTSSSWSTLYAKLQTWEKGSDGVWRKPFGEMSARIGRNGFVLGTSRNRTLALPRRAITGSRRRSGKALTLAQRCRTGTLTVTITGCTTPETRRPRTFSSRTTRALRTGVPLRRRAGRLLHPVQIRRDHLLQPPEQCQVV
jgi:hypothetical protein